MEKSDLYFVAVAMLVWTFSLLVTAWDFIVLRAMKYNPTPASITGIFMTIVGVYIRRIARKTLGKYYT